MRIENIFSIEVLDPETTDSLKFIISDTKYLQIIVRDKTISFSPKFISKIRAALDELEKKIKEWEAEKDQSE